MKQLPILFLFVTSLFAQGGGQPVSIPIPTPSFELGYGQNFSQTLATSPAQVQGCSGVTCNFPDGIYTLTADVANTFTVYPGEFEAELYFGTQKLCDAYGWALRKQAQWTFVCLNPGYIVVDQALPGGGPVQGTENFILTFTVNDGSVNGGWPIKFDHVSLTFTPAQ